MKRFFILLLSFSFFFQQKSFSQHEAVIVTGGSLFKGDVNRIFAFTETKPATGIFYRYYFTKKFTLRTGFVYATVSGNDWRNESFKDKDIAYKLRNLHFRSRIAEFSIGSEYFFRSISGRKSSPYMFAGLGLFYFNPQAKYKPGFLNREILPNENTFSFYKIMDYTDCNDFLWPIEIFGIKGNGMICSH